MNFAPLILAGLAIVIVWWGIIGVALVLGAPSDNSGRRWPPPGAQ